MTGAVIASTAGFSASLSTTASLPRTRSALVTQNEVYLVPAASSSARKGAWLAFAVALSWFTT